MAKMYIMGKYSEKAFLGFLKDPTTDRKAAVEKLTSAAGGKMLSMDIVRGPYDFIVVAEMANFVHSPIQGFAMKSGVGSIRIQELNFSKNQKNDLNTPIDRKHSLPIDCRAQN